MKLNGLEQYFETVNGEIVDFSQTDSISNIPLIFSFRYNKEKNLNLNSEQFDYLIKKSNLKNNTDYGISSLMYGFCYNKLGDINLNSEQWDYLIKNSDLKQIDVFGYTTLMYALEYNTTQNINLTTKQWKSLIEISDLSFIKDKEQLLTLKKIQSELINEEILNKIDIKEDNKKINKI